MDVGIRAEMDGVLIRRCRLNVNVMKNGVAKLVTSVSSYS